MRLKTTVFAAALMLPGAAFAQALAQPDTADPALGAELYQQSCAVCHGTNLQGQENWQSPGEDGLLPPPPHDESGHTWHHGDDLLFNYTKLGGQAALERSGITGFNSGMPPFEDLLSDEEIWNILAYIKSTWRPRIQEIQQSRTDGEQQQGN